MACWFTLTLKIKFEGQGHRSEVKVTGDVAKSGRCDFERSLSSDIDNKILKVCMRLEITCKMQ